MNLTFPHMGNTYIIAKGLLDELDLPYVIPPFNNKKALELGTKYAPEMACLPLKINIGNFIEAYHKGADTILMAGGQGPCRFGYYGQMHREILKDIGYPMDVISLEVPNGNFSGFVQLVRRLGRDFGIYQMIKVLRSVVTIAKRIDEMEDLCFKIRPRELKRGTVDRAYQSFQEQVLFVKGAKAILKTIQDTKNELLKIEIDKDYCPIKVGIVGEIYTSIDPFANLSMASVLGSMGIEVERPVCISQWIVEHMIKKVLRIGRDTRYVEAAKPYLGAMIGGHAQETIGHTVMFAQKCYDGVIQVYPLTCMPEIVAQSILPSVERDFDMPILTLIIDEMTGEAGYTTRLEAFVDLLKKRRERKEFGETAILSGN